jgi:hypothetical protein
VEQKFCGDKVGQRQGTYPGFGLGRGEGRCFGVAFELPVHGDGACLPVDAVQGEAAISDQRIPVPAARITIAR